MKKIYVIGAALALVIVASSVYAIGLGNVTGTKTESLAKDLTKEKVKHDLNAYLGSQNCMCNDDGSVTGCDLKAIADRVNQDRDALKTLLNRDVRFRSRAKTRECAYKVRDTVRHYYSYFGWVPYEPYMDKKISLWVE